MKKKVLIDVKFQIHNPLVKTVCTVGSRYKSITNYSVINIKINNFPLKNYYYENSLEIKLVFCNNRYNS